jgi:hypothetical protein
LAGLVARVAFEGDDFFLGLFCETFVDFVDWLDLEGLVAFEEGFLDFAAGVMLPVRALASALDAIAEFDCVVSEQVFLGIDLVNVVIHC